MIDTKKPSIDVDTRMNNRMRMERTHGITLVHLYKEAKFIASWDLALGAKRCLLTCPPISNNWIMLVVTNSTKKDIGHTHK